MDDRKRMPPPPLPVPAAHNTPSQAVAAEPHQHGTEEIPDSQDSTVAAPSLASMSQPSPKSPAHVDVKEIPDSQDTVMTEASPKEDARSRRPSVEPVCSRCVPFCAGKGRVTDRSTRSSTRQKSPATWPNCSKT